MRRALPYIGLATLAVVTVTLCISLPSDAAPRNREGSRNARPVVPRVLSRMLFVRDPGYEPTEIYMATQTLAGFTTKRVTDNLEGDWGPGWSPDGTRIAFVSWRGNSRGDIYTMKVDGTDVQRLTTRPQEVDEEPAWSPRGNRIAWTRHIDDNSDVWLMKPDGGEPHALTDGPNEDDQADWSPGSGRLVFRSNRNGQFDIYRVKSDGSELTQLTDDTADDSHPAWSPDGDHIAYVRDGPAGRPRIWVMGANGGSPRPVTDKDHTAREPCWSADGKMIIFTRVISRERSAICSIRVDGTGLRVLIEYDGEDSQPAMLILR